MTSARYSFVASGHRTGFRRLICVAIAFTIVWLPASQLRADPGYKARSGKIAFTVGANIPFLRVSGSSSTIKGEGEATVAGDIATIRNFRFELGPKTLKTGMSLRDQHMYEQVFATADGSTPPIILRADRFEARRNPATSKWEATIQAQLTMRGVTKPVHFRVSAEKKDAGAIVSAEGVVRTSDFGVKPIGFSGAKVNDEVAISVSDLRLEP